MGGVPDEPRELLETGTGRPAPGDVKIDNWN
jgi:hypothetical protein